MGNDVAKDVHDVHAVVDEMTDLQFSTDRGLLSPLQAETRMICVQASARAEIDGLQPDQGSLLHAWPCLRDDLHVAVAS